MKRLTVSPSGEFCFLLSNIASSLDLDQAGKNFKSNLDPISLIRHLRKPRVLTPLRLCVRNEVELVPLACEDAL